MEACLQQLNLAVHLVLCPYMDKCIAKTYRIEQAINGSKLWYTIKGKEVDIISIYYMHACSLT